MNRALPGGLAGELERVAGEERVTVFMVLLAAFEVLLGRYARSEDVLVGTPIAGRVRAEIEPLVGFFVNTLALRTSLAGDPSFRELLGRVRETTLGAYANQNLPFEQVVDALAPERSLGHNPIVQVTFALESEREQPVRLPGITSEYLEIENANVRFDLELTATETAEGITLTARYRTDLFDAATIERLLGHYQTLLQAALGTPEQPISLLALLDKHERHQLLHDYNQTSASYPDHACVHELIAAQAASTPHATAISYRDQQLDYCTLEQRANQLAHHLRERGVGADVEVAMCIERTPR